MLSQQEMAAIDRAVAEQDRTWERWSREAARQELLFRFLFGLAVLVVPLAGLLALLVWRHR